ncbi:MAG: NYN domain-containing protein [Anaerolineales bacterium]
MSNQLAVFIDFENVAIWAEHEFFDFELTPLMEYLQSRGPLVIKRAYGDWGRFAHYRDELMSNSLDLIQIYSVRANKNRADIRMAMDALETAMTRPHIQTFVIVSGDSDFGPLVTKLREYGRYTLGIGPRNVTHPLLVKSCDEFVYLETVLGEMPETDEQSTADHEVDRNLLRKALQAHVQRGEVPVLAAKLKHTMLLMDPAFNEANFGYPQFKSWLEDNHDLVRLFVKDLQLYVTQHDFVPPSDFDLSPADLSTPLGESASTPRPALETQYLQIFTRLKLAGVDFGTRRDVLRDVYRELSEHPGQHTTDELLDELRARYAAQGHIRSKATLRQIWQLSLSQRAFSFNGQGASLHAPVRLAPEIDSEAAFVRRAEAALVYAIVHAGLEVDLAELAAIILNDRTQASYIQSLLDDLEQRGLVTHTDSRYGLPGRGAIPFCDEPALKIVCDAIEQLQLPDGVAGGGQEMARSLAKTAMVQRSQDFSASGRSYLAACRLQWQAVEKGEGGATLEDLRWYMASYASVMAGKLSQVQRNYSGARPYYLAFFALVQEDDPLWSRMRGLINPMLSYYWANAGRELGLTINAGNLSTSTPAQIAALIATHPNPELRQLWRSITEALARINPSLLRRVVNQLRLNQTESPEYAQVADKMEKMLVLEQH